jgi:dTDP-4-amino-4,6-dideoxygalactose transaminase
MDGFAVVNHARLAAYRRALAGIPGLHVRGNTEPDQGNAQYVVVEVDRERAGLDRDDLVRILHAEHVIARRYFHPGCHRMEPYRSRAGAPAVLPETERASARLLSLPTGTGVTLDDVQEVADILRFAVAHADDIMPRLRVSRVASSRQHIAAGDGTSR